MTELRIALFCSRNKDNKHLDNFKERVKSYPTTKSEYDLIKDLDTFTNGGLPGEMSRLYVSINERNNDLVIKKFIATLASENNINALKLNGKLTSACKSTDAALTKKWLFDFDEDINKIAEFIDDVNQYSHVEYVRHTPNGAAVIVSHGFDTRDLLAKWSNVELKRDGMLCLAWKTNN